MKFVATLVAAFLGFASAKSVSNNELARRLKKGQFNKRTLMAKAKPYGRKLDQAEEEFEITGDYSIQFDYCLSLKLQDENLFGDNYVAYASDGKIVSEKSYVTFNVCKTDYCYYQGDDDKNTYIVDVSTFVMALADYIPQQQEKYCQGCEENQDYCYGNLGEEEEEAEDESNEDDEDNDGEDGEENDEDGESEDGDENEDENEDEENDEDGEGEDGEEEDEDRRHLAGVTKTRKLSKTGSTRKLAENNNVEYVMIDCDTCQEYNCFEDENEDQEQEEGDDAAEPTFDDVMDWIEAIAQCNQIEDQVWSDGETALYSGFICNDDGSGVEVALFLDEDCTMYTTSESYSNIIDQDEATLLSMSATLIQNMFTSDMSCDNTEVVYYNPYEGYEVEEDDENNNNNQDEEAPEANEWCKNIMQGDEFQALSLSDCAAEEAEEEEQENNNGDDDYVVNYEWYSYDLKQEDLEDGAAVCVLVRELNGEYSNVYSGDSSGHLFDYTKESSVNMGGMGGGAIAAIVIVALIVVSVGAAWALGGSKKKDGKKKPLISGSMA